MSTIENRPPAELPHGQSMEGKRVSLLGGHRSLPHLPNQFSKPLPETPPVLEMLQVLDNLKAGSGNFFTKSFHFKRDLNSAYSEKKVPFAKYLQLLRAIKALEKEHEKSVGRPGEEVVQKCAKGFAKLMNLPESISQAISSNVGDAPQIKSFFRSVVNSIFGNAEFEKSVNQAFLLAEPAEQIGNKVKNLVDYLSIKVGEGETAESVADQLLKDLTSAKNLDPPMSRFRGQAVDESNRGTLETLLVIGRLQKMALVDVIAAKQAKDKNQVHFCQPILQSIQLMKTQEEADKVGHFLMSEVCQTGGGRRELDLERFKQLKNDPRVRNNPLLLKAVLKAAIEVQIQAIRKTQMSLVQDIVKKLDKADWKAVIKTIEENRSSESLDLNSLVKFVCKQSSKITEDRLFQELESLRTKLDKDFLLLDLKLTELGQNLKQILT